MTARNDITGDAIATGAASDEYRDNFDRIFRKGPPTCFMTAPDPTAHQCATPGCDHAASCKREQR